ncbi:MAG: hypothetical protein KIS94_02315 [Chitinophagales bacterium]|nr:hypothetical protein [Chitinophagales bacterium]
MKKMFLPLVAVAFVMSASSCARCYVCKDKDRDSFTKVEYCDKDFDKGDVDAAIKNAEANGATCHAKMRAF